MKKFWDKFKELYSSRDVIVSLQHMLAMLGATIVVPLACGMNVSMTMLAVGIGTICFHFITKKKVPVFLGSSLIFVGAYLSIIDGANFATEYDLWCQNMGKLAGAIVFAGIAYLVFSLIIKLIGVDKIKKVLPPTVIGPIIMLIGITLIPNVFWNDVIKEIVIHNVAPWAVLSTFLITIITIFVVKIYAKPNSLLSAMPIICGFAVGYVYSLILAIFGVEGIIHFTSFKQLRSATVFGEIFGKNSVLGFWKYFTLDFSAILSVLPLAIVSMMEHLGDIQANGDVCGKNFYLEPGVHKTMLGDGVAIMIAGSLGAPTVITYSENTAVLEMTKSYEPKNILLAAIITVILGLFTPISALFQTIPAPVIGAVSTVLFGMISVSGMKDLIDHKVDMMQIKNILVVASAIVIAVGISFSSLFGDVLNALMNSGKLLTIVNPQSFKFMLGNVEVSALALSTLTAIIFNLIIPNPKNKEEDEIEIEQEKIELIEDSKEKNNLIEYKQKEKNSQENDGLIKKENKLQIKYTLIKNENVNTNNQYQEKEITEKQVSKEDIIQKEIRKEELKEEHQEIIKKQKKFDEKNQQEHMVGQEEIKDEQKDKIEIKKENDLPKREEN